VQYFGTQTGSEHGKAGLRGELGIMQRVTLVIGHNKVSIRRSGGWAPAMYFDFVISISGLLSLTLVLLISFVKGRRSENEVALHSRRSKTIVATKTGTSGTGLRYSYPLDTL
jgi:hypothetical protein